MASCETGYEIRVKRDRQVVYTEQCLQETVSCEFHLSIPVALNDTDDGDDGLE